MIEEFKIFAQTLTGAKNKTKTHKTECWWYSPQTPTTDFNKELISSGKSEYFPDGVLAIRCDDDFWAVAALPLKFKNLSIQEIVSVLWPDIIDPEYGEDNTDCYT